jgi:hypothetical protein
MRRAASKSIRGLGTFGWWLTRPQRNIGVGLDIQAYQPFGSLIQVQISLIRFQIGIWYCKWHWPTEL